MNVQSDDVPNIWFEGPLYWEDNTFTKLFTQKILEKFKTIVGCIYEIKVVF